MNKINIDYLILGMIIFGIICWFIAYITISDTFLLVGAILFVISLILMVLDSVEVIRK